MTNTERAGNHCVTLDNVKIEGQHFENNNLRYLCKLIILFLGAYGSIKSFLSCYDFGLNSSLISLQILLLCIISYFVFQFVKQYKIVVIVSIIAFAFFCIVNNSILLMSINTMLNDMKLGITDATSVGPGLCIILLSAIVIIIMAYLVVLKNKMILVALCSLPIACIGMFFGLMPSILPLVCIGMYMAAMAVISEDKTSHKNGSIEIAGAVAILIFSLFAILSAFIPEGNFKRIELFKSLKATIENTTNQLSIFNSSDVATGGVNGGQLGKYDKIIYSNKIMLKLNTGDTGKLYLRSFVGANYSDNRWTDPSQKSEKKYSFLFDELDSSAIEIYNQTSELMKIIDNDQELIQGVKEDTASYLNSVYKRDFYVEYVSMDGKFYYLPYGSMYFPAQKSSLDGYPINNKNQYISSTAYTVTNPDYEKYKHLVDNYSGTNISMISYIKLEKSYRKFVYGTYLDVDSKYKNILQKITTNYSFTNEQEKYKVIDIIKDYLARNYTYTLEPGAVPSGKDFLDYFLNENKQGYCTYFATAATILFRAAGIPTRYVEGYSVDVSQDNIISTEDISSRRSGLAFNMIQNYTQRTIAVRDNDSHAWVEIYQDGYGWVPIEVTPGKNLEINNGLSSNSTFTQETDKNSNVINYNSNSVTEDESSDVAQGLVVNEDNYQIDFMYIWKSILAFLKGMIICIIVLFFVGIMIFMPARLKEKKRDKLLAFSDDNEFALQIIMIYSYIERISVFLKFYRAESMSYIEYYDKVKAKYAYFKRDGIDNIITAALKVRFANADVTSEELNKVIAAAVAIRKDTFANLSKFDKLRYRFFCHLY